MRDELMMGYCAGVSFVDKQVGKLLDVMDQLDLWKNTTVVLTADHGMHCGEKAIWCGPYESISFYFDESKGNMPPFLYFF